MEPYLTNDHFEVLKQNNVIQENIESLLILYPQVQYSFLPRFLKSTHQMLQKKLKVISEFVHLIEVNSIIIVQNRHDYH